MSDEDVRKYCERLKRAAEPPVQVDEVDSCFPRTQERVGITLEDDPEGQCLSSPYFGFCFYIIYADRWPGLGLNTLFFFLSIYT